MQLQDAIEARLRDAGYTDAPWLADVVHGAAEAAEHVVAGALRHAATDLRAIADDDRSPRQAAHRPGLLLAIRRLRFTADQWTTSTGPATDGGCE